MKSLLKKEKVIYILYVITCLVGIWFLVRLWIPTGYAIAGHDSGLAIDASEFFKSRLYAWDVQGFGRDNSSHFGSLIMHFIDYVSSVFSGVLYAGNQLNVFFWISAIFISATILAVSLKEELGKYTPFLFPIFITINFYILQSIFIFERSKYSLLVASMLFLTVYLKMRNKKISIFLAGLISSLILFFLNGGSWLGIPLYGNLFVMLLSISVFEFIMVIKKRIWRDFLRLLALFAITGAGFLILNAYSIFPYVSKFLSQDFHSATNQGVISANKGWLDNLSQASSFLNIFRLQGVPDWYVSETKINPIHTYADLYTSNRLLIFISFIFPILILSSFFFAKTKAQKLTISLFGILLFFGAFFMAGSHPPFGFIYVFLYNNIPGFSIFRSPFYKFGGIFYIAATALMAFSLSYLIEKYSNKIGIFITLIVAILWLSFYSVIFEPNKIFSWQPEFATRMVIPSYVYDFAKWIIKQPTGESRILLLPPLNSSWKSDVYNWGYWSLTNLPSTVSNKSFVTNAELEKGQEDWVNNLYQLIEQGDAQGAYNLSKKLDIDYILLRNDVLSNSSWSSAPSPKTYEAKIDNFGNLTKIAVFGQWSIYKFNRDVSPLFYTVDNIISINQNYTYLSKTFFQNENSVFAGDVDVLGNNMTKVVNSYSCQSCPLEEKEAFTNLISTAILPNSPFYFFKQKNEDEILENLPTDQIKIDNYLGFVLRKGSEIKFMWDLGLNTDSALDSLSRINKYLKETSLVMENYKDSDQLYFEAKKIVDNLNVIEKAFKDIVSNHDFISKKQTYRQGILDVIWNINELKKLFSIIDNRGILEKEKIYLVPASGTTKRNLYIDGNTLPSDLNGQKILPENVIFISDGKTINVNLKQEESGLYRIILPKNYGTGKIILKFSEFPNLFKSNGFHIEQSPTGSRQCLEGSLIGFDPKRKYRVEINATKPWQTLKLFLKDNEIKNGDSQFVQGQDEAEISPTLPDKPFYHIYQPSGGANFVNIYLCNSNTALPEIESLAFHEIISPNILAIDELPKDKENYPKINFIKINPTHYKVNISEATKPFVLVFNQSYNSLWKLDEPNSQHFLINGYANAWRISKLGDYTLDLSYIPQSKFKKGLAITFTSFLAISGFLVIIYFRKKINEKK